MTTPSDPQNPGTPDPYQSGGSQEPSPGGYTPPAPGGYNPPPAPGSYPPPPAGGGYNPPPAPGNYPPPPPAGGAYPPPPPGGAYPPPPAGGAYPPAGGAYPPAGGYQPAPGVGAYGAPSPAGQFSVGDAISYGWSKFSGNALPWVLVTLAWLVIQGVLSFVNNATATTSTSSSGFTYSFGVLGILVSIIAFLVSAVFQAALINGALRELDGQKPQIGDFFQFRNIGAILLAALLLTIGFIVGLVLLVIGAIVFGFFAYWTYQFVLDRDQSPIDAIKSSFSTISKNIGPLLLLAIANFAILIVGAILCGLGLLVAYPVVALASTYAFRYFTGGNIAPVGAGGAPGNAPYPPQ